MKLCIKEKKLKEILQKNEDTYVIRTARRLENNLNSISAGNYEEEDLENTLVMPEAFDEWKRENIDNFDWKNTGIRLYLYNDGFHYYRFKDIALKLGF